MVHFIRTAALDYETTTFYQLQVTITDNGSPATSSAVDLDVTITNVNEGAPVFTLGTYSVTVPEDTSLGSNLLTVTTSDVDHDTVTYSFQTAYSNFIIDPSSGAILLAQTLDYDTTQTHSLLVVASDGTATTTATTSIDVTDVNESPVFATTTYTYV
ncbi:hypothetical protein FSP39_014437 [Pinctada imbricata]|uniref:Cadherin domain-containing protein n=1 Tax=Pinctada imbricata TaxID=66713 RepID=A0AA88YMK9_PINIB|nr:hypothetical protein FSP39_014437 [Pinctada imbricata]